MNKKLFTLFVAFLVMAGFQQIAAQPTPPGSVTVLIHAGKAPFADYYGVTPTPGKLTWNGTKFVYSTAAINTELCSNDRIKVEHNFEEWGNVVTFRHGDKYLELKTPTGATLYRQFTVFVDNGGLPGDISPWGGPDNDEFQTVFNGYLGINFSGPKSPQTLIVYVKDSDGTLELRPYSDTDWPKGYTPLYIQTEKLGSRWATPDDLASCRFITFQTVKFTAKANQVEKDMDCNNRTNGVLTVSGKTQFIAKKVDMVQDGRTYNLKDDNDTIIGFTNTDGLDQYGEIPLYTIHDPNGCKVISVSRENDIEVQHDNKGGYGNKLELRDYGYYQLPTFKSNGTFDKYVYRDTIVDRVGSVNPWDAEEYVALQKFAIWIDEDGDYILYPFASYFWEFGEEKYGQEDDIRYNDVLLTNNRLSLAAEAIEIGGVWVNRESYTDPNSYNYIGTIPAVLQTYTAFRHGVFAKGCNDGEEVKPGRFYYLQVDVPGPTVAEIRTKLQLPNNAAGNKTADSILNVLKQKNRTYVLTTQVRPTDDKRLVLVPKDSIGYNYNPSSDEPYWWDPVDSVNMAAHWQVEKDGDAFRFINMLGDTLQYDPADLQKLAGGYLTYNSIIAGGPYGHPLKKDNDYLFSPTETGSDDWWFKPQLTTDPANVYDLWYLNTVPGTKKFVMELKDYGTGLIFDSTWDNPLYGMAAPGYNGTGATTLRNRYYQRDVALEQANTTFTENIGETELPPCLGGLQFSLEEIFYVPTYGTMGDNPLPFYQGEPRDNVINTTMVGNSWNGPGNFQYNDSLTAYTFLTGIYDISVATDVKNELILGIREVNIGNGTIVPAAAFVDNTEKNAQSLEFIPLSKVGYERSTEIAKFANDDLSSAPVSNNAIDTLYGEKYKWYVVKGPNQKYLTFDTINRNIPSNREKVGFVFTAELANATPIRLYQPLVGDKQNSNFLIQFYLPLYTYQYVKDTRGVIIDYLAHENKFPEIKNNGNLNPIAGGGEVCFATVSNNPDFIYAARGFTDPSSSGARFTVAKAKVIDPGCASEFIDPEWMGDNRLLSLPLNNQIWVQDKAEQAWIAKGQASTIKQLINETIAPNSKRAIEINTTEDDATTLTHTYVTSIRIYDRQIKDANGNMVNEPGYETGTAKVGIPLTPGDRDYKSWIGGSTITYRTVGNNTNVDASVIIDGTGTSAPDSYFKTDLEVPLYYVQNDEGMYLTVVPHTEMRNEYATASSVTSIRLEWRKKIEWYDSSSDYFKIVSDYGYDPRALQLFAISGCKTVEDGWYGKFIYLPLASYMVESYKNGSIMGSENAIKDVFYNVNLGEADHSSDRGNKLTDCWRVAQWAPSGPYAKDLIVADANTQSSFGSIVPIEFKLSKQRYLQPACEDYFLVQNTSSWNLNSDKNKFYDVLQEKPISAADQFTLSAHWALENPNDDEFLYTFAPELKEVYGTPIGDKENANDQSVIQRSNQLRGQYYFVKLLSEKVNLPEPTQYQVIDVSEYATGNWKAKFDTLTLSCVKHAMPFFDLEADGTNVDFQKLAILETPYVDRNLTYINEYGNPNAIKQGTTTLGWEAFVKKLADNTGFTDAEFLRVYRQNRRALTDNHIIPYYAFSITKDSKEYFLTINPDRSEVYWREFSDKERYYLENYDNDEYANELKYNKFCLPYKRITVANEERTGQKIGDFADPVKYGDAEYIPVYLQTLDTAIDDYPYLVISYSSTAGVSRRYLPDAMNAEGLAALHQYNIYTVDYRYIIPRQVTSWIFGGKRANGLVWVPIAGAVDKTGNEREGAITVWDMVAEKEVGLLTELGENKGPVNYAISATSDIEPLKIVFKGDTTIGTWDRSRIWYYNVILNGQYLTDATTVEPTNLDYWAEFYGGDGYYPRAYWKKAPALPEHAAYVADGIKADKNFAQTFGFRYVINEQDPDQVFYIVSNANYTDKLQPYRYLARINNTFVFVNDPELAMTFKWGDVDENGKFVGLEVVGQGGIYGVAGGVKLLNTTGKVEIFSIDGRLIKSAVLTGSETTIPAPRGIVVVKNGDKRVKVVVQ